MSKRNLGERIKLQSYGEMFGDERETEVIVSEQIKDVALSELHPFKNHSFRLLVKPVKSAVSLMPNAIYGLPYDGAKEMLLVDNVDNKDFLTRLFVAMYDELPAQKKKKS